MMDSQRAAKILVVGAGALGGLAGAPLLRVGVDGPRAGRGATAAGCTR